MLDFLLLVDIVTVFFFLHKELSSLHQFVCVLRGNINTQAVSDRLHIVNTMSSYWL
jgi:hypothetical protein